MKTLIAIISLLILAGTSMHAQGDYERVVKEAFKTSGSPTVEIETRFGSAHVTAVSGTTVKAVVRITAISGSQKLAKKLADAVRVELKGGGSYVSIRTALPAEMDEDNENEERNIDIEVTVSLPVKSKLKLESKFGEVDITGVMGLVDANCRFGSVEIKKCANVSARNAFGDLSLGTITGSMRVSTKMGQVIAYNVPGGSILSSYGDVEVTKINGALEVKSSMGSMTLKGLRNGNIENSYGSVEITVPKSFGGSIEATSSFGSIDTDFDLKREKAKRSHGDTGDKRYGTIGKGNDKIIVESSFGDITIEKE
ncbi:MAG: hypothetical protein C0600_12140 [Ignavibacteria bacterium]|nr:MAG: hypothetical protein C0600_12140 [Ignavibacteria bacterium]